MQNKMPGLVVQVIGAIAERGGVLCAAQKCMLELLTRGVPAAGLLVETYIESPAFPSYCTFTSLRPCLDA